MTPEQDRAIDRIAKLLRLSTSPEPHESAAALARARQLFDAFSRGEAPPPAIPLGTYKKLGQQRWGAIVRGFPVPGDVVALKTRQGVVHHRTVARVLCTQGYSSTVELRGEW